VKKMRFAAVLILLTAVLFPASALEGADLKELIFLPPDFYVGDRVEMRAFITPRPGMRLLPAREIPVVSWIEIHEVELKSGTPNWEIRISFTPYAAGTRTFPSIVFGDVVFSDVKLHTESILQERDIEFFGIKDQLFLPGTRLALGIAVAVLLFGPIFILSFTGRFVRGVKRFVSVHAGRRPYKQLSRVLKDLQEKNLHMSSRKFYIILSEEFRNYLSNRTEEDFLTITSSEIGEQLSQAFPVQQKRKIDELVKMMQQGDLIKFGGVNAGKKQRESDLQLVQGITEELEEFIESERQKTENESRTRRKRKKA